MQVLERENNHKINNCITLSAPDLFLSESRAEDGEEGKNELLCINHRK